MKTINKIFALLFVFTAFVSCNEDFMEETDFEIVAPSNVSASFNITQDNTGLVTITPIAEGALSFDVDFGDGSAVETGIAVGKNVNHTYSEGNHTVGITAKGLNNLKTAATVELVVSFKAPQNLVVAITNDESVSKKVNVVATADYATTFDFLPGEADAEAVSANIGQAASFTYKAAGTYSIKVTAKGGAIATTDYSADFEVTALLQPTTSAPTPKDRPSTLVKSVYSASYTASTVTNFNGFPDWGQAGQGSSWAEYDLNGDKMLQYIKLSYQGNQFDAVDVSGMEFVHIDVWTADAEKIELSVINTSRAGTDDDPKEKPIVKDLVKDQWNSIDIPLKDYTDLNLNITAVDQLKYVGTPWAGGSVFIDNVYFYKASEVKLPIRFDQEEKFAGVGGAAVELSTDPDDSSNVTAKVTNGGNDWETAEIILDVPISITSGGDNKYSVRIYSPDDAQHALMMKLEQSGDNEYIELSQNFTGKGWNTVNFDMSTVTAQAWPNPGAAWDGNADFKKLVFFIDGGSSTPGVYHLDDIAKNSQLYGLPIYFNDITLPFKGVGGAGFKFSIDPDDSTNKTGKVTNGGNDWETAELIVERPISIVSGADNNFFIKIYSPDAESHALMMKLEQSGDNEYIELSKPFQGAGWNTVNFDMSTITAQAWPNPGAAWDGTADFKKLVFFIDGGSATPGVYHLDDIVKRPAVGLPIDFDTEVPFKGVGGAGFEFSTDPDDSTNKTGKVTNGGNDWETAELILDTPISIVKDATNTFTVKIYSPDAAKHALMMKLEQSGANEYIELSQDFEGAGWNTVTFDMSTVTAQAWPNPGAAWDGTADFKKLVFFIDGGSATPGVYHLDDIIKN
jgi:hypothetical protein